MKQAFEISVVVRGKHFVFTSTEHLKHRSVESENGSRARYDASLVERRRNRRRLVDIKLEVAAAVPDKIAHANAIATGLTITPV